MTGNYGYRFGFKGLFALESLPKHKKIHTKLKIAKLFHTSMDRIDCQEHLQRSVTLNCTH